MFFVSKFKFCFWEAQNQKVFFSFDNGVNWTSVVTSNTTVKKIRTSPQPDGTDQVFVAGLDAFYYWLMMK